MTTYYVNPATGNDGNSGTSEAEAWKTHAPLDVDDGTADLQPGDEVVYATGVVHEPTDSLTEFNVNGTEADPIVFRSDTEGTPAEFDGRDQQGRFIRLLNCSHYEFRDLEPHHFLENVFEYSGLNGKQSRNVTFIRCRPHHYGSEGGSTGGNAFIAFGDSMGHTHIDCAGYVGRQSRNSDAFYVGGSQEHGWGGDNVYTRCAAWLNADDGFDFFASRTGSLLESCVAHSNGHSGEGATGDGNGFKLGGGWKTGGNECRRCVAYDNDARGFDMNGASVANLLKNNTSWRNGTYGFQFTGSTEPDHQAFNNISVDNAQGNIENDWNVEGSNNTWDLGIETLAFLSTDPTSAEFLRLPMDSPAVNAGTPVDGISMVGDAPDLGAFEFTGSPPTGDNGGDTGGGTDDEPVDGGDTGGVIRIDANGAEAVSVMLTIVSALRALDNFGGN